MTNTHRFRELRGSTRERVVTGVRNPWKPRRPGGRTEPERLDVLSTAGLINYFGKHALSGGSVGTVDLNPVLMRKGSTKVALYGLGYIRDNRLHQMFNVKDAVVWHRPGETKESSSSSWFNVMLIHQNRAAHSKNAISERYLPNWLDFVVWGHEHECLVEPTESAQGFHVSQPGSSVVTSLIEGEAKQKKMCVLEVKSDPENPNGAPFWRTTPVRCVRRDRSSTNKSPSRRRRADAVTARRDCF